MEAERKSTFFQYSLHVIIPVFFACSLLSHFCASSNFYLNKRQSTVLPWECTDPIANCWLHRLILVSALVRASRHQITCGASEQEQRDLEFGKENLDIQCMVEWLQTSYTNHTLVFTLTVCLCAFPPCSFAFQSDCFLCIHAPGYQWQMHIETATCFLCWCLGPVVQEEQMQVTLTAGMVFDWLLWQPVCMSYVKTEHVYCM